MVHKINFKILIFFELFYVVASMMGSIFSQPSPAPPSTPSTPLLNPPTLPIDIEEYVEEETAVLKTEMTPFWSFELNDGKFYVVIPKYGHPNSKYSIKFSSNKLTLCATHKCSDEIKNKFTAAVKVPSSFIDGFLTTDTVETEIEAPFELDPDYHDYVKEDGLLIRSYSKKSNQEDEDI